MPAPRNAFTGRTYTGNVPFSQLFTPIGFNPNQLTVLPATPRGVARSSGGGNVVVHNSGGSKGF